MIKKIIVFLSCLIVPFNLWAKDACTNPDEYTVDKRCYVTDEQKKEKPYNAVAAVLDDKGRECGSGTVVEKKGWLYLYTSKMTTKKYCKVGDSGTIMLPNGEKYTIFFRDSGSSDVDKAYKEGITIGTNEETGDWAIYAIHDKNLPSVNISNKTLTKWVEIPHKVTTVGVDSIKIMSDKDIEEFRRRYVAYLRKKKKFNISQDDADSFAKDIYAEEYEPIDYSRNREEYSDYGKDFVDYLRNNQRSYFLSIFLPGGKRFFSVSRCVYKSNNKLEEGCQAGSGASGAGVFDEDSNLVGMQIGGYNYISGPNHLSSLTVTPVLRNPGQQIKHGLGKAADAVANGVDSAVETVKECVGKLCGGKDEK